MRVLFDLNVLLDVLLDRSPHADVASRLWAHVERKRIRGYVPAHGVTTIFYLASRSHSRERARAMVRDLLSVFRVPPLGSQVLEQALNLACDGFEDAVCAASAASAACDVLVTRDEKGFRHSNINVMSPSALLAALAHL